MLSTGSYNKGLESMQIFACNMAALMRFFPRQAIDNDGKRICIR